MSNDIGGVWRTIGGRRVFIKDGEDLETAMRNSGKFNNVFGNYKKLYTDELEEYYEAFKERGEEKSANEIKQELDERKKWETVYDTKGGGYQRKMLQEFTDKEGNSFVTYELKNGRKEVEIKIKGEAGHPVFRGTKQEIINYIKKYWDKDGKLKR